MRKFVFVFSFFMITLLKAEVAGIYYHCAKDYYSSLELTKKNKFYWEYHYQGRIVKTKGVWQSDETGEITLNPQLNLETKFSRIDTIAQTQDSLVDLVFYLNGKIQKNNYRLLVELGTEQAPLRGTSIIMPKDTAFKIKYNYGFSSDSVSFAAGKYAVFLQALEPDENLVRRAKLKQIDETLLILPNIENPDLLFEKHGRLFYLRNNKKETEDCPHNVHSFDKR